MRPRRFATGLIAMSLLGLWVELSAAQVIKFWPSGLAAAAQAAAPGGAPVGTWSGNLSSRNFASFPATIAITQDANGNLRGAAVLHSSCMSEGALVVRFSGSNISLVGSDRESDNITFRGTLDSTGTQMSLSYILNASASGRCETDQGSGTLTKQ